MIVDINSVAVEIDDLEMTSVDRPNAGHYATCSAVWHVQLYNIFNYLEGETLVLRYVSADSHVCGYQSSSNLRGTAWESLAGIRCFTVGLLVCNHVIFWLRASNSILVLLVYSVAAPDPSAIFLLFLKSAKPHPAWLSAEVNEPSVAIMRGSSPPISLREHVKSFN